MKRKVNICKKCQRLGTWRYGAGMAIQFNNPDLVELRYACWMTPMKEAYVPVADYENGEVPPDCIMKLEYMVITDNEKKH